MWSICSSSAVPFRATISIWKDGREVSHRALVSNIKILKKRSLRTTTYDAAYPKKMPFYLYGTADELHIDHMLLLAPNIQLTAGSVQFSGTALEAKQLEEGVIAIADEIHEEWMQPFPSKNSLLPGEEFFFHRGKTLSLTLYADPFTSAHQGKVDLSLLAAPIGRGEVTLKGEVYVDCELLNRESTFEPLPFKRAERELPAEGWAGKVGRERERAREGVVSREERANRWHDHFRDVMGG